VGDKAGPRDRNVELLAALLLMPVHRFDFIDLLEDAACVDQKFLTLLGGDNPLGGAFEDGDSQLFFQILDRPAQVWLAGIEVGRRLGHRARPIHFNSIL
jgi:hypothetical protein